MTLPVTNQELIFSKFLTVGTIGVASALLNVLSMGGIGVYLYKLAAQTTSMVSKIQVSKFDSGNLSLLPVVFLLLQF